MDLSWKVTPKSYNVYIAENGMDIAKKDGITRNLINGIWNGSLPLPVK